MSARHRQHKRKIADAKQALADCYSDLTAYARVLVDMKRRSLPTFSGSQTIAAVAECHAATAHDIEQLHAVVADLERMMPA